MLKLLTAADLLNIIFPLSSYFLFTEDIKDFLRGVMWLLEKLEKEDIIKGSSKNCS
jgi:hypothetical protein